MMESLHGEDSVHAHTLRTTLGEHKQHFSNLVVGFTLLVHYPFFLLKNPRLSVSTRTCSEIKVSQRSCTVPQSCVSYSTDSQM